VIKLCYAKDCEDEAEIKNLCAYHYNRAYCGRDINRKSVRKMTVRERFMSKINKSGECWLWEGTTDSMGVPVLRIGKRTCTAARVALSLLKGEISPKLKTIRTCGQKTCVRPDHLKQKGKKVV
jgi:hypothetical protein